MKRLALFSLVMLAGSPIMAQVRYFVSTDSLVYHYGDSIHVTVGAVNLADIPDTLWLSDCDVEYIIDDFNLFGHRPCALTIAPYVILPHDSVTWTYLPPYPINRDTLTVGKHAVVGEIGGKLSDTLWVTVMPGAAMVYHVSTDSSIYHYGDSIHVTVSAANIGSEPDTLELTLCDVAYTVDSSSLIIRKPCPLVIVPTVVSAGDSVEWSYLPPYPVTKDTLTVGKHAIVGVVNGYGRSDTLWVSVTTLSAIRITSPTPRGYVLENAYPDPFNPSTRIDYRLPARSHVSLTVYDVLGRKVSTLVNEIQNAGLHSVTFNAAELPSGVYFDRLEAGPFTETSKLLLLK